VAFGNPFGPEGTATLGIVDTLMRNEIGHEIFEDFITNTLAVEMPPPKAPLAAACLGKAPVPRAACPSSASATP
jgi:hypothetical protein